ncbi:Cytochrome P450 family protein [Quillaja saponaria]|uniref:Cytochrome P450 family protein n=1 Tax=Quillaja saponaria TaxID=32244 RepID=A0AAD7PFZ5_QUISA|nr:Cytochrome P450 family protein [Quillaja saponaria]
MDFLQPLLLVFVIFLASCYFVHQRKIVGTKNLPPGSLGWPLLGETHQFLFNKVENFVGQRMKKYSSKVFKTNILGEPTVVFSGPDGNKLICTGEPKLVRFSYTESQRSLFDIPLPSNDSSVPPKNLKLGPAGAARLMGFLKPDSLVRYTGEIESITNHHFRTHWEGKEEVKAYQLTKTFVLTLSCHFFLGLNKPDCIAKLVSKFDDLHFGIHSLHLNIPGTTYNRASKAAAAIRKEVRIIMQEKIAAMSKGAAMTDLLSQMIVAEQGGKFEPHFGVCNTIVGLMSASYKSVVNALTFMIKHIGEKQDVYQKILFEQTELAASRGTSMELDWENLQKMKYTWAVAMETMRITPPTPGAFRQATTSFNYGGYTIPKGWKIFWAFNATNKSPEYFPEPEKFDPSRFEGNGPAPYTFVPFGGGPRTCPGKEYTRFLILIFIHNLVRKLKWEVLFPNEEISGIFMPIPAKGLPIRLQPL